MGTEGTDGESSSPYCPLSSTQPHRHRHPLPFPDVCILIILAPWLAPCTLFTHSSIHIHLACTCLVPTRVTWREWHPQNRRTHALCLAQTQTGSRTYAQSSPLRRQGSKRAMKMSERGREEGNEDIKEGGSTGKWMEVGFRNKTARNYCVHYEALLGSRVTY